MGTLTLPEIAKKMRDIDFAMLLTHTENGQIAGRPMSNNRDVEYDGDSFYFTWDKSRVVNDIERDSQVALSFQANTSLLGKPGLMVAVEGTAELIRDQFAFEDHWNSDLDAGSRKA